MLWVTLSLSAGLVAIVNLSARKWWGLTLASMLCGAGVAAGLIYFPSAAFLLNALLLAIVGLSCLFANASRRAVLVSSLIATLAGFGSAYGLSVKGFVAGFADAKPFSLRTIIADDSNSRDASLLARAGEIHSDLDYPGPDDHFEFEPLRTQLLRTLHDRHVQLFVNSPGNGIERMPSLHKLRTSLLAKEVFPLPESDGDSEVSKDAPTWQIHRLELISLLKHDPPVAYASGDFSVRMFNLQSEKTRPLDAFEEASVKSLNDGNSLVVQTDVDAIHMVGAVRAGADCLRCHTKAKKGELFGAFSYELRRETPKP
jgi:hypothetical protein